MMADLLPSLFWGKVFWMFQRTEMVKMIDISIMSGELETFRISAFVSN